MRGGCLTSRFSERRAFVPLLCCCWLGSRKELQLSGSWLGICSTRAAKAVEGEDEFWLGRCSGGWLRWCWRFHDAISERGGWEDDFCFPARVNEISGVAQADGVMANTVCRESKKKEETTIISWYVWQNQKRIYHLEPGRWISWRKLKSIHKSTECFVAVFLSLEVPKQSSQVRWWFVYPRSCSRVPCAPVWSFHRQQQVLSPISSWSQRFSFYVFRLACQLPLRASLAGKENEWWLLEQGLVLLGLVLEE